MYIAFVKQRSEGCDYTIGCGQTLWILFSKTKDDALLELKEKVVGTYDEEFGRQEGYWDEMELSEALMMEVSDSIKVPIGDWYKEAMEYENNVGETKREKTERLEYERLKSKFSG